MTRLFILLGCLLSTALVQADPAIMGCCKTKKKHKHHMQIVQEGYFSGCGCGGGNPPPPPPPPPQN
jgi:hypothetical protein